MKKRKKILKKTQSVIKLKKLYMKILGREEGERGTCRQKKTFRKKLHWEGTFLFHLSLTTYMSSKWTLKWNKKNFPLAQ